MKIKQKSIERETSATVSFKEKISINKNPNYKIDSEFIQGKQKSNEENNN